MSKEELNEAFRNRTKAYSVAVICFCKAIPYHYVDKLILTQLVRSASSVAANYRAACRARSKAEFHSKISIVVEEADEAVFWLEVIEEAKIDNSAVLKGLIIEGTQILKIVASTRKGLEQQN
ncbi:MAG: four helix bundle protein [Cytophagaceae bacterium]|nr:four helix bundle protein [Cytophagaceae bacterium]